MLLIFFIFNLFFNNILISTRFGFYLHGVARLVAPLDPARQIASVAPVHVARQGGHAGGPSQRCVASAVTWPPCRARRAGATRPMSWARAGLLSPTLPFFPSLLPGQTSSRASPPAAAPPQIPQIRRFGGEWGETFPTLLRRYCSHFFLL